MTEHIKPKHGTGNCWDPKRIHDCKRCGGELCDVCHKHDEPRGSCSVCPPCPKCDEDVKEPALDAPEETPVATIDQATVRRISRAIWPDDRTVRPCPTCGGPLVDGEKCPDVQCTRAMSRKRTKKST